jgi:hypothetical protein
VGAVVRLHFTRVYANCCPNGGSTEYPIFRTFTLKRQCHEMNNFSEGLKNQISTFCISADSFLIFAYILFSKRFIEASQNFTFLFSITRQLKNFKTISAYTVTDLIVMTHHNKIIRLVTQSHK